MNNINETSTGKVRNFIKLENDLINEKKEVNDKCERLERWLAVHETDRENPQWYRMIDLMYKQLFIMREYVAVLSARIELHHMNEHCFH